MRIELNPGNSAPIQGRESPRAGEPQPEGGAFLEVIHAVASVARHEKAAPESSSRRNGDREEELAGDSSRSTAIPTAPWTAEPRQQDTPEKSPEAAGRTECPALSAPVADTGVNQSMLPETPVTSSSDLSGMQPVTPAAQGNGSDQRIFQPPSLLTQSESPAAAPEAAGDRRKETDRNTAPGLISAPAQPMTQNLPAGDGEGMESNGASSRMVPVPAPSAIQTSSAPASQGSAAAPPFEAEGPGKGAADGGRTVQADGRDVNAGAQEVVDPCATSPDESGTDATANGLPAVESPAKDRSRTPAPARAVAEGSQSAVASDSTACPAAEVERMGDIAFVSKDPDREHSSGGQGAPVTGHVIHRVPRAPGDADDRRVAGASHAQRKHGSRIESMPDWNSAPRTPPSAYRLHVQAQILPLAGKSTAEPAAEGSARTPAEATTESPETDQGKSADPHSDKAAAADSMEVALTGRRTIQQFIAQAPAAHSSTSDTAGPRPLGPVREATSATASSWAVGPQQQASSSEVRSLSALLTPKPTPVIREPDFLTQLVDRIQTRLHDGESVIRIQLKPSTLGRLEIKAETSGAAITATIIAESTGIKAYLEQNLHLLQQSFQDHGLRVERIDVAVQDGAWPQHMSSGSHESRSGGGQHSGIGSGAWSGGRIEEAGEEISLDARALAVLGPHSTFHTVA